MNKILFIDPSPRGNNIGGSTISLFELLYNIETDPETTFTVLFLYPNAILKKFKNLRNVKINVLLKNKQDVCSRLQAYYRKIFKYISFFIFLLKHSSVNLIVINSRIGSGRFAILCAKLFRKPIVVHERLWTRLNWYNRTMGNMCNGIIAVSKHIRESLIDGGINQSIVEIVYNGVTVKNIEFRPIPSKDHTYKIIMAGNITPWKGQHIFVESYKYLQLKNVEYFIVGEINDKEYYISFSDKIDNKSIHYTGFISDIISEMKNYDILIHASQKPEPFGRTVIEAMSAGVPVIAANIGGPLETIEHLKTGLHFQYNSPIDLAKKIDMLLQDDCLRLSLQKQAFQSVRKKFNIINSSEKTVNIYKSVLKK